MEEEFEKFEAEYKQINGKKTLVIKAKVEEKINLDGTKDVIIHAPALSIIQDALKIKQ